MSKKGQVLRVLIADDEALLAQRLTEFLTEKGFVARFVRSGPECMRLIENWNPDFVFYDLMLPELNALEFLRIMAKSSRLGNHKTKVFVFSGHSDPANIRECMRLGATDYIAKPFQHSDLMARIILHMHPKLETPEYRARSNEDYESAQYYLHLTDLSLREALKDAPVEETLHNLTGMLGVSLGAVRVSIVKCESGGHQGAVVASSDRRKIGGLILDLGKYPEILYVINSDKLLALDNLEADSTMHFLTRTSKSIQFNSMIVAPIRIAGKVWGVLSVRLPETKNTSLTEFEIRYTQLLAHLMGVVAIRDAALLALPEAASGPRLPEKKSA